MTLIRATTYVGIASVLSAWLAAAGGMSVSSENPQPRPRPVDTSTQALAHEVEAQASRLRTRLSAAPAPHEPLRNPFAFASREASRPARAGSTSSAAAPVLDANPPEPALTLAGLAERETAGGVERTAMITADSDELFMLVEGDTLGGRYRVKSIAAETVELTDLVTGATRRLSLR
jgi:hypothetical protein